MGWYVFIWNKYRYWSSCRGWQRFILEKYQVLKLVLRWNLAQQFVGIRSKLHLSGGLFYADFYADIKRSHYYSSFKQKVESRVRHIKAEIQSQQDANPTKISMLEVKNDIKDLKKSFWRWLHLNEHLIYGGDILCSKLAKFYTDMLNYGYIPTNLKEGIIITLHKGGRKSKKDQNYCAITLKIVWKTFGWKG